MEESRPNLVITLRKSSLIVDHFDCKTGNDGKRLVKEFSTNMQKGASDDLDDKKMGTEGGNQTGVAHKTFLFYSA